MHTPRWDGSRSATSRNYRIGHSLTRLHAAREALQAAPIRVVAHSHAASLARDDPQFDKPAEPMAVLFDDPDLERGWDLVEAHELAHAGAAVVVTLPRQQVPSGRTYHCDLGPAMRLADIVLEVRLHNLAAVEPGQQLDEPGRAAIAVIRNRRGPIGTVIAAFEGHYARFVDVRPGKTSPPASTDGCG